MIKPRRFDIYIVIGVLTGSFAVMIPTVVLFVEQEYRDQTGIIIKEKQNFVASTATRHELRIDNIIKVLKTLAGVEEFYAPVNASLILSNLNGIPPDADLQRREVAQSILGNYNAFEAIFFVLPNGQLYFVEPYQIQESHTLSDFSSTKWYKAVMATGQPYVGKLIVSASTGHKTLPIAVPVYASEGMVGIIAATLDLGEIESLYKHEIDLSRGKRVIYSDFNDTTVLDISDAQYSSDFKSEGMSLAASGKSGYLIEDSGNQKFLTIYRSMRFTGNNWGLVLIQPLEDAFRGPESLRDQSYGLLTITGVFLSAGEVVVILLFRRAKSLSNKLYLSNLELNEKNSELARKEQLKSEFVKMAAHELRTPVQPILMYVDLARDGVVPMKSALDVIERNAKRLQRLSGDILDVSRIESGQLTYRMEALDLDELVMSVIRTNFSQAASSIRIEKDLKARVSIVGDERRLEQVLSNVIGNAVKFTGEGVVTVTTKLSDDRNIAIIEVADSGPGIHEEVLPALFGKFVTMSPSNKLGEGTGLGLFISKAIIQAHGGQITGFNNPEGGATFRISLPTTK